MSEVTNVSGFEGIAQKSQDIGGYARLCPYKSSKITTKPDKEGQIMSSFVNVGAMYNNPKQDVPTKTELKRALQTDAASVLFYTTSAFGEDKVLKGTELDHTVKYVVAGPNPYKNRKWFATVEFGHTGRIVVK